MRKAEIKVDGFVVGIVDLTIEEIKELNKKATGRRLNAR